MNNYTPVGKITNYAQLQLRIAELQMYKEIQEEEIKLTLKEAFTSLNLISIFKSVTTDQPIQFAKSAINTSINLIIDLVLGRNRSIKGFLSSLLVEQFTSTLVNNNLMNIISTITNLTQRFKKREKDTE